ncbi:hypothetical protein LTS15_008386 [Exophiala xenobiotica]|nr:hypothetical protein LTS15_008386 [Exophiala xenobiotica]
MASVTIGGPATEPVSAGNLPVLDGPEEPVEPEIMTRTDVRATRLSISDSQRSSESLASTTSHDDRVATNPKSRQSFLPWLKSLARVSKDKFAGRTTAKKRLRAYVEQYYVEKEDRKALETILSKLGWPNHGDLDPRFVEEGIQFEIHVPSNNVCDKGIQGFKGLVDTGSRGYSLVRESVVNDLAATYTPTHNFPTRQQDRVRGLKGIGKDSGYLHVLGSIVLQIFHPDAPEFMFPSTFYVVSNTDMEYDFLLGTDLIFSVRANKFWLKKRLMGMPRTIAALSLFRQTTIVESVEHNYPSAGHTGRRK